MPLYYFNILDGVSPLDDRGTELADVSQAREEAIQLAGELIAASAKLIREDDVWSLAVQDYSGKVLIRADFTVKISPV